MGANQECKTCGEKTFSVCDIGDIFGLEEKRNYQVILREKFISADDCGNQEYSCRGTALSLDDFINYLRDNIVTEDKSITVTDNEDGTFSATNTDGDVVATWATDTTVDTFAVTVDNGDGTFTTTNPDGSTITFNGAPPTVDTDSFVLVTENGSGVITAVNVDGSSVQWQSVVNSGNNVKYTPVQKIIANSFIPAVMGTNENKSETILVNGYFPQINLLDGSDYYVSIGVEAETRLDKVVTTISPAFMKVEATPSSGGSPMIAATTDFGPTDTGAIALPQGSTYFSSRDIKHDHGLIPLNGTTGFDVSYTAGYGPLVNSVDGDQPNQIAKVYVNGLWRVA